MSDFKWPETIDTGQTIGKMQKLHEGKPNYAFYFEESGFGFGQATEIAEVELTKGTHPEAKNRTIVEVKHLSGNSWGRTEDGRPRTTKDPYTMHWLICSTDYYPTMNRAMDALTGKTEIPKGKRKPRKIEPMTEDEIAKHFGLPKSVVFQSNEDDDIGE